MQATVSLSALRVFFIAASLMEINNVSHESLVHIEGQRSYSSCNLYTSEIL